MARILIVDDSWLIRHAAAKALAACGYDVEEVTGGRAGLERVAQGGIDCVLLDLLMPDIDGLLVLAALKANNNMTPVIVMSADIQETTKVRCTEAGAFDFIQKPPTEEVLKFKIKEAIRKSSGA